MLALRASDSYAFRSVPPAFCDHLIELEGGLFAASERGCRPLTGRRQQVSNWRSIARDSIFMGSRVYGKGCSVHSTHSLATIRLLQPLSKLIT